MPMLNQISVQHERRRCAFDPIAEVQDCGSLETMLSKLLRDLPYLVHTNRELGLMLAGKKPLAYFVDGKDRFPQVVCRYLRLFDSHVEAGRIVRCDHFSDAAWGTCHHIFYALPREEWRIQAMLDLVLSDDPWSFEQERRQGELLGYAHWMNDYWLEQIYRR